MSGQGHDPRNHVGRLIREDLAIIEFQAALRDASQAVRMSALDALADRFIISTGIPGAKPEKIEPPSHSGTGYGLRD